MVKIRVSATIEKETGEILDKLLESGEFRNKSHIIEKAIGLLMEAKNGEE